MNQSMIWPLASTTTFARTSRSGPSSGLTRTPTARVALEQHLQHARPLVDVDAVLAGVVQQQVVELAAADLPGLAPTRAACGRRSRTAPKACRAG